MKSIRGVSMGMKSSGISLFFKFSIYIFSVFFGMVGLFSANGIALDLTKECTKISSSSSGQIIKENTTVRRAYSPTENACDITVNNVKDGEVLSRRYVFGNQGNITVVTSNPKEKRSGTKVFFIFPIGLIPDYQEGRDGQFSVRAASGTSWIFDSKKIKPIKATDCEFSVSDKFSTSNTGVDIKNCKKHLIAELPHEIGGQYTQYSGKPFILKDPKGGKCHLINDDLYRLYGKKDGRGRYDYTQFKFQKNDQLKSFLKVKCSKAKNKDNNIDLSYLDVDTKDAKSVDTSASESADASSSGSVAKESAAAPSTDSSAKENKSDKLKQIQQQILEEEGVQ